MFCADFSFPFFCGVKTAINFSFLDTLSTQKFNFLRYLLWATCNICLASFFALEEVSGVIFSLRNLPFLLPEFFFCTTGAEAKQNLLQ